MAWFDVLTGFGERPPERWVVRLRPGRVLDRVAEATDPPRSEGGPWVSHGRVIGRIGSRGFRLTLTSMAPGAFGRTTALVGEVRPHPEGSVVEVRAELPNKFILWVLPAVLAVGYLMFLASAVAAGLPAVLAVFGLLIPLAVQVGVLLLVAAGLRAKTRRLVDFLDDLLDDVRVRRLDPPAPARRSGPAWGWVVGAFLAAFVGGSAVLAVSQPQADTRRAADDQRRVEGRLFHADPSQVAGVTFLPSEAGSGPVRKRTRVTTPEGVRVVCDELGRGADIGHARGSSDWSYVLVITFTDGSVEGCEVSKTRQGLLVSYQAGGVYRHKRLPDGSGLLDPGPLGD